LADPRTVDTLRVPGWAVEGSSGKEMIAWVEEAMRTGLLAVFIFHGVGGGSDINVGRDDHRVLLEWLHAHRQRVWVAPFLQTMQYVISERGKP
jgi:sialate O-acetylesterase